MISRWSFGARLALVLMLVSVVAGCPSSDPPAPYQSDSDSLSDLVTSELIDSLQPDIGPGDTVNPEGCLSDLDCPAGKCNPVTNTCVECLTHTDCPPGNRCDKWTCVETAQCGEGKECPKGSVCEPVSQLCVQCLEDGDCTDGALCVGMTCLPPCDGGCPEPLFCHDEMGVCVECLEDGQCELSQWCNLDEYACYPDGCEAGETTCIGNSIARCADNGSGWASIEPCPDGMQCDGDACWGAPYCEPGASHCLDETTFERCNEDGTQYIEGVCPTGQRCEDGLCFGECIPLCDGKECGPSNCPGLDCGICPPDLLCSDDGRCFSKECAPGERVCLEGGVVTCMDNGEWSDPKPCAADETCQDGKCVEVVMVCQPGFSKCQGNFVVTCNADGSAWGPAVACPDNAVCQDGFCKAIPPVCEPGQRLCAGELAFIVCLEDGKSWSQEKKCPPATLCNDGECVPNPTICQPGSLKCDGMVVVRCRNDGMAWEDYQACPPGTQCLSGACKPLTLKSCANVLACFEQAPCELPFAEGCFPQCFENAEPEAFEISMMLYECVFKMCGSWAPKKQCYKNALSGQCYDYYFKCTGGCMPQCAGKECGDDGCGGSCGFCDEGSACLPNGTCQGSCVPNCFNKDCGPDGCGSSCGTCPFGSSCNSSGICVQSCVPNCTGKVCGSDGCGGVCGLCGPDEACKSGKCIVSMDCKSLLECNWSCPDGPAGEQCGNECWADASPEARAQWQDLIFCVLDVCGDSPSGPCFQQSIQGACKSVWNSCQNCTPACTGKQCGADGCGGSCGNCPAGFACDSFGYCLCQPQCAGKQCGNDLCGGSCGTCPNGSVCNYLGKCVCMPKCDGKQCGADGCGGTCGTCPAGQACNPLGICESPVPPSCGNGWCQPDKGETCSNCQKDCGPCNPECGDGYCSGWEDCYNCPWDCGECPSMCGDGWCDYDMGESCEWCPDDCGPCESFCGDGYCDYDMGESCDWCKEDCGPCEGYCGDYYCDYNAGESCDWCPTDCGPCEGVCGDGYCDYNAGESCEWCPEDCGPCEGVCGDGYCDYNAGESCEWCPQDCGSCGGYCGDQVCDYVSGENCASCQFDCGPCGGGDCCYPTGQAGCQDANVVECVCSFDPYCCEASWDDICVEEAQEQCGLYCGGCEPNCMSADGQMLQCGSDGCGGSCGTCQPGRVCQNGLCVPDGCVPSCYTDFGFPKQCGSDGCGGSCGQCPPGTTCDENMGFCVQTCVPNCSGKQCGPNGCGGSCGTCPSGYTCSSTGQCVSSGMSCKALLDCAMQCNYETMCMFGCFNQASPEGQQYGQSLLTCVSNLCGFQPTPTCVQNAFNTTCAQQYQACLAH